MESKEIRKMLKEILHKLDKIEQKLNLDKDKGNNSFPYRPYSPTEEDRVINPYAPKDKRKPKWPHPREGTTPFDDDDDDDYGGGIAPSQR